MWHVSMGVQQPCGMCLWVYSSHVECVYGCTAAMSHVSVGVQQPCGMCLWVYSIQMAVSMGAQLPDSSVYGCTAARWQCL